MEALAKSLCQQPAFKDVYEHIDVPPIRNVGNYNLDGVAEKIAQADVIFYQFVGEVGKPPEMSSDNILKHAKSGAERICMPSMYFDGYFPHVGMMRLAGERIKLQNMRNVHDFFAMAGAVKNIPLDDLLIRVKSPDFYPKSLTLELFSAALEELSKREDDQGVDIRISDFIREHYKDHKLFNQQNHPRGILMNDVIRRIMEYLGLEWHVPKRSVGFQDTIQVPLYVSTYKNLECRFEEDFDVYKSGKKNLSQREVFETYYAAYGKMDKAALTAYINDNKPYVMDIV